MTSEEFLDCLRSNYERGKKVRLIERNDVLIHMGISTFATFEGAAALARSYWPKVGTFVAELRLVEGYGFQYTRANLKGHLTIWGRPDELQAVAEAVSAIDPP
jgi:hypothetical protein